MLHMPDELFHFLSPPGRFMTFEEDVNRQGKKSRLSRLFPMLRSGILEGASKSALS